jgi:hypothetical protein
MKKEKRENDGKTKEARRIKGNKKIVKKKGMRKEMANTSQEQKEKAFRSLPSPLDACCRQHLPWEDYSRFLPCLFSSSF